MQDAINCLELISSCFMEQGFPIGLIIHIQREMKHRTDRGTVQKVYRDRKTRYAELVITCHLEGTSGDLYKKYSQPNV